ncbi:MAG: Yip1 family protein [bacterium]
MPDEINFNNDTGSIDNSPEELSFSDKIIGVITSPVITMESVSKHPPKAANWLIPIIIFIIISGLASFLYYSNPALKAEMENKSMEAIEKSYQEQVDKGKLTQQEADEQKEKIMSQMQMGGSFQLIFQVIGVAIYTFLAFFLVNGLFFLFIKYLMKGDGGFNGTLTAYGLSYYILILQTIVTIILSLAFDKFYIGFSLANFFDVEWMTFPGFLLRKADPFLIWFYAVLGISYAKMFNSDNIRKYLILTYSVWILGNLILYYLSTVSQIFSGFAM